MLLSFLLLAICVVRIVMPSVMLVSSIPSRLYISQNELNSIELKGVSYSINHDKERIDFKLFNIFTIKSASIKVEPERKVFLGGFPVGLSMKINGVVVVELVEIETDVGMVRPKTGVEQGDILIELNGKKILYVSDIQAEMKELKSTDKMVEIKVLRKDKEEKVVSYPVKEILTGFYKLGFSVKDNVEGVGMVSYVRADNRFGSLGHSITNSGNNSAVPCYNGEAYNCKINGCVKGARGVPGELRGMFTDTDKPIGEIRQNSMLGVYGNLTDYKGGSLIDVGSRFTVKMGKAQILTTIDGNEPQYYDIEILKTMSQNAPGEKGMIIRATDKKLLSETGGILQGMSGSPIIQNNKLIGAVTHVFINDPTKGYAVYLDWMYDN